MARPRRNTAVVQDTTAAGTLPANRPIDHARRIGSAIAVGVAVGTLSGVMFLDLNLTGPLFFGILFASLAVVGLCLIPWLVAPKHKGGGIPVVARTLGTTEPVDMRYVHRGTNRAGLLVPVVVHPLDGSPNFRSVVIMRDVDSKNPKDPPVGTLFALDQLAPGQGELVSSERVTEEQARMIERLRKRPRELSNAAAPLPLRRGPLERTPWWAGLQWWLGLFGGAFVSMAIMMAIAG